MVHDTTVGKPVVRNENSHDSSVKTDSLASSSQPFIFFSSLIIDTWLNKLHDEVFTCMVKGKEINTTVGGKRAR